MSIELLNLSKVNGEEICELVREMADDSMEVSFDDVASQLNVRWEVMGRESDDVEEVERRESDKYYLKLTRRLRRNAYDKHGMLVCVKKGEKKHEITQSSFVEGRDTESVGTVQDIKCSEIVGAKDKEQEKFAIYNMLKAMLAMKFEGDYSYDDQRMDWMMERPLTDLTEEEARLIMERAFSLLQKLNFYHWGKMYVGYENGEGVPSIKLIVKHFAALDYDWSPVIDLVDETTRTAEEVEDVMCASRYGSGGGLRSLRVYSTFGGNRPRFSG